MFLIKHLLVDINAANHCESHGLWFKFHFMESHSEEDKILFIISVSWSLFLYGIVTGRFWNCKRVLPFGIELSLAGRRDA
jgi:hypothetical protein